MRGPRSRLAGLALAGALAVIVCAGTAAAATHPVQSISELQSRLTAAVAGDTIVVRDGVYTTSAPITVNRVGTAEKRITIVAQTIGGVEITGTHGFTVSSPAAHVVIEGFKLTHASGTTSVASGATHVRFTRNVFECAGPGAYLTIAGHDAEVDGNEFRNKRTLGNMIDVRGEGSQVAQRVWIHHNYFHDFANAGGNGAETIRFGLSGLSLSNGHGLIEHNLFVRCMGENELISNKSSANTYRYNTFLDSPGAQLTIRHGNECLVYGNYLRRTAGIRIFGDRHRVFSNYLEGNSMGINIGNGGAEVAVGAPLTSHDRPDGTVITFNTLVDNACHYCMTPRSNGLGATGTVFANNVVQGGSEAARIEGPYTGGAWSGNIVWKTAGAGAMPAGTYDAVDPRLEAGENGVFRPQPGSPAIDTAKGAAVPVDMDGQPRTGALDRGADELSSERAMARMLAPGDVPGAPHPSASPSPPPAGDAAGHRRWTVDRLGLVFELTAKDLRAWKGDTAGQPVFSMQGILAAEKKSFDGAAAEGVKDYLGKDPPQHPDHVFSRGVVLEVLSVVGPLVTYEMKRGESYPGTAHPSGSREVWVKDVSRPDATPSLLDFFPEKVLVDALKADPWIRKFDNPERGFAAATSLEQLVRSLDAEWANESSEAAGDCELDVSFTVEGLRTGFAFHHLEGDRVAVRIAVTPSTMWCLRVGALPQIGLLLPIPAALREDLARASRREAGFLMRDRKAMGSPAYAADWEVDLSELAKLRKGTR